MKITGFAVAHTGMLLWALLIAASFSAAAQVSQAIDPILLTGLRLLFCALVFVWGRQMPMPLEMAGAVLVGVGMFALLMSSRRAVSAMVQS
jgi:drug/metabolite transporter (DMT)-like permease